MRVPSDGRGQARRCRRRAAGEEQSKGPEWFMEGGWGLGVAPVLYSTVRKAMAVHSFLVNR